MRIPEKHKQTIQALLEADPEVMQATCDIPHEDPMNYLYSSSPLPYCGCFVGVYGWMHACKRGQEIGPSKGWRIPGKVSSQTAVSFAAIRAFGMWCKTHEKDHAAVRYARSLLAT